MPRDHGLGCNRRHPGHGRGGTHLIVFRDGGTRGHRRAAESRSRTGARERHDAVRDHAQRVAGANAHRGKEGPRAGSDPHVREVGSQCVVIGEVTENGFGGVFWQEVPIAMIPVDPVSTEAPVYERPMTRPAWLQSVAPSVRRDRTEDGDLTDMLLRLVASPNLCSKHWIFEQYDTTVRTNTVAGPEKRDAAVVRVK